jgi:hypothetical protein
MEERRDFEWYGGYNGGLLRKLGNRRTRGTRNIWMDATDQPRRVELSDMFRSSDSRYKKDEILTA